MKKTLKLAAAAVALSTPAMAANLENPLYMPEQGAVYSKTGAGVMYKIADDSAAHVTKNHNGEKEFPILRVSEDLGYGITDRLAVRGSFMYTQDDDIGRKGMNHGRLGAIYRAIETLDGMVLDVYADAVLGGISQMEGAFVLESPNKTYFNYDNYSTGRWGFDAGIRFGKTWSKLTTSAFVEVVQTFGNDNNEIRLEGPLAQALIAGYGMPEEISVKLKNTTELNFGLNAFYEIDDRWSVGGLFKYTHHADNGVESLETELPAAVMGMLGPKLDAMSDMNDGFDEYMIGASVAYQLNDMTQVALYGEYTFDDAHAQSQNGTDVKAEIGVRMNVQF